jgi:cellulose synthase (UDP-forming)
VDVYVCTYDEPESVLRATLTGCRRLTYPHTTYLLDDGRRPHLTALAAELGAYYLTRPNRVHGKAGNVNHALTETNGDLVLVLDADHVPLPDALGSLVGYFDDERVAVVQTPLDYFNFDSSEHYEPGRHERSVFAEVISPGKDRHDSACWHGSAAMVRRSALRSAGGVARGGSAVTTTRWWYRGRRPRRSRPTCGSGTGGHSATCRYCAPRTVRCAPRTSVPRSG